MADVTYIPDQQNQANNLLPWMLASQGGGFGFGGLNSITDLFGLAIVAQMFGWNGGGLGNMGGNAGAAAGFIANQMNNDSGREQQFEAVPRADTLPRDGREKGAGRPDAAQPEAAD